MAESQAKENILNKIRQALVNPVPLPFPGSEGAEEPFSPNTEDSIVLFAEEFTKLQGNFAFCSGIEDLRAQLHQLLKQKGWDKVFCSEDQFIGMLTENGVSLSQDLSSCHVSVTGCEYLVARTGSIVLSSVQQSGRTASVYAPVHICIAFTNQVLYEVKDALVALKTKYADAFPSFITFASGPSRTADIEKTLVTGVHGPKEVFCFLVEKES